MTVWTEGQNGFYFAAQARLIENDRECAWAEKYVLHNKAHAWVLGRYVEADRANSNRQFFEMEGLRMAQPTISHAPMNINHEQSHIVGAFVATDFLYPEQVQAGESQNPYIEALGVMWKAYFPNEYEKVQQAHKDGRLFYSMECVPEEIGCIGDGGCGQAFEYAGLQSPTYCSHLNEYASDRDLIKPHFTAGALIIPPVRPGWNNADVHSLVAKHAETVDRVMAEVASETPHLGPREWEQMMAFLLSKASKGSN